MDNVYHMYHMYHVYNVYDAITCITCIMYQGWGLLRGSAVMSMIHLTLMSIRSTPETSSFQSIIPELSMMGSRTMTRAELSYKTNIHEIFTLWSFWHGSRDSECSRTIIVNLFILKFITSTCLSYNLSTWVNLCLFIIWNKSGVFDCIMSF